MRNGWFVKVGSGRNERGLESRIADLHRRRLRNRKEADGARSGQSLDGGVSQGANTKQGIRTAAQKGLVGQAIGGAGKGELIFAKIEMLGNAHEGIELAAVARQSNALAAQIREIVNRG
jgi:hypothetical protein